MLVKKISETEGKVQEESGRWVGKSVGGKGIRRRVAKSTNTREQIYLSQGISVKDGDQDWRSIPISPAARNAGLASKKWGGRVGRRYGQTSFREGGEEKKPVYTREIRRATQEDEARVKK